MTIVVAPALMQDVITMIIKLWIFEKQLKLMLLSNLALFHQMLRNQNLKMLFIEPPRNFYESVQ